MICRSCRDQDHRMCRGGTWCDCAHRTSVPTLTVAEIAHRWNLPPGPADEPLTDLLARWMTQRLGGDSRL